MTHTAEVQPNKGATHSLGQSRDGKITLLPPDWQRRIPPQPRIRVAGEDALPLDDYQYTGMSLDYYQYKNLSLDDYQYINLSLHDYQYKFLPLDDSSLLKSAVE